MRRNVRFVMNSAVVGAIALGSLGLGGCGGGGYEGRLRSYRNDPTPRIDSLSQTGDEISNRIAITTDTNYRNLNEDLGRLFLADRPSRLAKPPIPY